MNTPSAWTTQKPAAPVRVQALILYFIISKKKSTQTNRKLSKTVHPNIMSCFYLNTFSKINTFQVWATLNGNLYKLF